MRNRHNDAVRNPMRYTLGTAAKATGKAKSTILRAVKSGAVSATKAHDGSYEIEPSELHRVFPTNGAQQVASNDAQPFGFVWKFSKRNGNGNAIRCRPRLTTLGHGLIDQKIG